MMSVEVDVLLQEAKESIEAAQNFRSELQQRLNGLNQARKQVRGSSGQAREALRRHFAELQAAATRLLSERLSALLTEVDAIEADSVKPLDDCQSLVEYGVGQADELLREGEAALRCGLGEKEDKLGSFTKKALHIQLDSLPEVPALVDVPCVSAQFDDSLLVLLRDHVCRHGSVASHPPVLIEELQERPGSILVRWCKVDEDFAAADYRLQYRRSGNGGSQYEDAYVGRDTDFLALGLDPNTDYVFRVCARGEGRTEWSPWSVAQTGYTTMEPHGGHTQAHTHTHTHTHPLTLHFVHVCVRYVCMCIVCVVCVCVDVSTVFMLLVCLFGPALFVCVGHLGVCCLIACLCLLCLCCFCWCVWTCGVVLFCVCFMSELVVCMFLYVYIYVCMRVAWRAGTEGYIVSSRRNIALRNDSAPSSCPVLYSNAPTYFCGLTLTFKISATGQLDRRDSLGVCVDGEKGQHSLQRDQAVCISTNGAVYVNGKEMTNQLPSVTLGSAVTFDMEVVGVVPLNNNNHVSGLKLRVTIGSGSREVVFDWMLETAVDGLFFGCSFAHAGWKVLVF